MRAILALALTLCLALGLPVPLKAQNALIPPGAESLPERLRRLAVAPLVLTPGSDRTACLGAVSDSDSYDNSDIKLCDTIWSQRVTLEAIDGPGSNRVRLRFGDLGCLYSNNVASIASIGICDDRRAAETWTVRDRQLVDQAGRCLEAAWYEGTKTLRPQTLQCDPARTGQQWYLESMRAVQDRMGAKGRAIWGMDSGRKDGLKREVVEQLRPRFSVRQLTSSEKSEVRKLRDSWKNSPALPWLELYGTKDYWKKRESMAKALIDWPVLKRLSELAESGDRDAMHAVLEGLIVLQYGNARESYKLPGWQQFPEQGNYDLVQVVVPTLADIWGAHYWQRHGPDRLAALSGASCLTDCLGYSMQFVQVGKYANPFNWARTGKSDYAFKFENFSFVPVTYTPEQAEKKFLASLEKLSWGESPGADDTVFGAMHAARTGRLALWDAVILSGQSERWGRQSKPGQAMLKAVLARREDAKWRAEFATFMGKAAPTSLELWQIQRNLVGKNDADVFAFAQRYTLTDRDLLNRFCVGGRAAMPSCQRGLSWMANIDAERAAAGARAQAEADAKLAAELATKARWEEEQRQKYVAWRKTQKPSFWDQLAGLAEGFDAAMRAGSGTVTVREYDKAGNYLGSREVSRAWAAGQGATPVN